ncbi:MAG TPA: GNAT family N-acetyltransferase [Bryobacteraceae bacterium]|nr:GNAT family N-acetyltransferase [Bryobacteraceae bacterium]
MGEPEIRVLSEADAAEFWAVRLRGLREEPESFGSAYEESVDTPLEDVARRLKASAGSFVLGAFAPNLVGTVGCYRKEGLKLRHKAMIWGMYVVPESRGRALGRALLTAAIARAREVAGLEQLLLQVGIANAAAAALYKSLGFAAYGMEPRGLKIGDRYCDEYLIMLELSGKYGLE